MTAERKTDQELVEAIRDQMADYVMMQSGNLANVTPESVKRWFRTQWEVTSPALLTRLSELRARIAELEAHGRKALTWEGRLNHASRSHTREWATIKTEVTKEIAAFRAALTTPTEDDPDGRD